MAKTDFGSDLETLEKLVDTHSLQVVLTMLECICDDKSSHLMENYQDKQLSKLWKRSAGVIRTTACNNSLP